MATHAYNIGNIYQDGEPRELLVYPSQEAKIQGEGKGSYKVYGRLKKDGEAKPLLLIDTATFEMTETGVDDNLYTCDVSGLYSISAEEVQGVEKVYARAFALT